MKTLIAYYSLEGTTRRIAERMAEILSADLLEIKPVKEYPAKGARKFLVGGFEAFFSRPCPIQHIAVNPADYDLLIVGAPVWAGKPAPPILSFLKDHGHSPAHAAVFVTHLGSQGKAVEILTSHLEAGIVVSSQSFHTGKDHMQLHDEQAHEWAMNLSDVSGKPVN